MNLLSSFGQSVRMRGWAVLDGLHSRVKGQIRCKFWDNLEMVDKLH